MKRQIIIGDIHGCFDEFEALLEEIGITDEDEIISLGDIVDRGPKSVELYEYFKNKGSENGLKKAFYELKIYEID